MLLWFLLLWDDFVNSIGKKDDSWFDWTNFLSEGTSQPKRLLKIKNHWLPFKKLRKKRNPLIILHNSLRRESAGNYCEVSFVTELNS